MQAKMKEGLGLHIVPDMRRALYPMGAHVKKQVQGVALPDEQVWRHGKILDQGNTGTCVGHAWVSWENCEPRGQAVQQATKTAFKWYDEATQIDPWDDNDNDTERQFGTSTQAGVEIGIKWGLGQSYVWAERREAISAFVRSPKGVGGPVVLGTNWYGSMFETDFKYFLHVDLRSGLEGGHEWMIFGVTLDEDGNDIYHCQQSWGEYWGDDGIFYLHGSDLDKLIMVGAESCTIIQTKALPRL
jgi:hypothetical protein